MNKKLEAVQESEPRLCVRCRASSNPQDKEFDCTPETCDTVLFDLEATSMLGAIEEISRADVARIHSGDGRKPILGSELAGALTILALASMIQASMESPFSTPDRDEEGRS